MKKITVKKIAAISSKCEKHINVYPNDDYEIDEVKVNKENFVHLADCQYVKIGLVHVFSGESVHLMFEHDNSY